MSLEVTVREGDTLSGLALAHLGDATRWPEIYRANRAAILAAQRLPARRVLGMGGPDWIFPGTVVKIAAQADC